MSSRAWLYFVLVSILWGIPYFFIKVALKDLTPLDIAFGRVLIGALCLLPVAILTGSLAGLRSRWAWLLLLAVLEFLVPLTFISTGEQHISSSLTGILIATEPALVTLLAHPFDKSEHVNPRQIAGMAVGLAGVVVLLGFSMSGTNQVAGAFLVLVAALSYAGGALLIKWKFSEVSPIGTIGVGLGLASLALAIPAIASAPHAFPSSDTVGAMLVLGIPCTAIGFITFSALIGLAGAGRAALIAYVAPAVAVALGVALGGDIFGLATGVGLALILAGSWLASIKSSGGSQESKALDSPQPLTDVRY